MVFCVVSCVVSKVDKKAQLPDYRSHINMSWRNRRKLTTMKLHQIGGVLMLLGGATMLLGGIFGIIADRNLHYSFALFAGALLFGGGIKMLNFQSEKRQ